jgi:hypothetical protein
MDRLAKPTTERGEIIFEISITFVPIALLFVVFLVFGDWRQVLEHEEWLFVSAVLQAQALGKVFVASDHPTIRNKSLLYTVGIFLVIGIVWCSVTVAKHVIFKNTVPLASQYQSVDSLKPVNPSSEFETNFNARVDNIEKQLSALKQPVVNQFWSTVQNILAVVAAAFVFAWVAQIERKSRKSP